MRRKHIVLLFFSACFLFSALKSLYDLIFSAASRGESAICLLLSLLMTAVFIFLGYREYEEYKAYQAERRFRPSSLNNGKGTGQNDN